MKIVKASLRVIAIVTLLASTFSAFANPAGSGSGGPPTLAIKASPDLP